MLRIYSVALEVVRDVRVLADRISGVDPELRRRLDHIIGTLVRNLY
jgi:hypothetical protein